VASSPDLDTSFRALFELSPDAILVVVDGIVTHANPAAVALLGAVKVSDLVGRASRDLISSEGHRLMEENATSLMSGEKTATRAEERYRRLDGSYVNVEAHAARAAHLGGKAFIVILRDLGLRREVALRGEREREAAARTAAAEEREKWLRDLIDLLPLVVFAEGEDGSFILVNRKCAEFLDRPAALLLGKTLTDIGYPQEAAEKAAQENGRILRTGRPSLLVDREIPDGRGRMRLVEGVKVVWKRGDGRDAVLAAFMDATERRDLQKQLLGSQRMEGMGRLAGGIAHDFNNLLTVIVESSEHLSGTIDDPEGDLGRIREAATRATSLTRQLLAFAREAPARPRLTPVDDLVQRMAGMLLRVLGEDVRVRTDLGAPQAHAYIDAGQLDVVIVNAAVNARDAMPNGGTLVLSTRPTVESVRPGAPPLPCVVIQVTDTGTGMDEATRQRAFEPFFTTKQPGAGTGLGLSTSYGIVEQLGGRIELESELGKGTTLRIVLPVSSDPHKYESGPRTAVKPAQGTVLLLEDEPAVRRATSRLLRSLGYSVLEASRGEEALSVAREYSGPIDALVTDVVMPDMNGVEAARQLRAFRPEMAVLYMSGFSREALPVTTDVTNRHISKPFTKVELAVAVHDVIQAHQVELANQAPPV
jgi:two-component system cell cycle sensor histidine kinase/response regulator CckA